MKKQRRKRTKTASTQTKVSKASEKQNSQFQLWGMKAIFNDEPTSYRLKVLIVFAFIVMAVIITAWLFPPTLVSRGVTMAAGSAKKLIKVRSP